MDYFKTGAPHKAWPQVSAPSQIPSNREMWKLLSERNHQTPALSPKWGLLLTVPISADRKARCAVVPESCLGNGSDGVYCSGFHSWGRAVAFYRRPEGKEKLPEHIISGGPIEKEYHGLENSSQSEPQRGRCRQPGPGLPNGWMTSLREHKSDSPECEECFWSITEKACLWQRTPLSP